MRFKLIIAAAGVALSVALYVLLGDKMVALATDIGLAGRVNRYVALAVVGVILVATFLLSGGPALCGVMQSFWRRCLSREWNDR